MLSAAFQEPVAPPAAPGTNENPLDIPERPGRVQDPTEPAGDLGSQGPSPLVVDPNAPPITRPGLTPDQARAVRAGTAGFAAQLSRVSLDVSHAQLAGLANQSRPYVMNPAQALQLGLINSRPYQFRIENVYLQSLAVTLQRFGFSPQFYAGVSPSTSPGQGFPPTANGGFPQGGTGINQFTYRTALAPGGQASNLTLSQAAGFGKLFVFGGRLLAGFASTTVFNFVGNNPRQPTVQSGLPLSFIQPLLRGGGRAVTLEPLTQAERTLLYEVRSFARFRQQFFVSVLASAQSGAISLDNPGNTGDPTVGYLQLLQTYQQAENTRINIAAFERALEIFTEYARGGASSGISQLQVDQIDQQRQQTTVNLIAQQTQYRNILDQYKRQLGMPPDVPLVPDLDLLTPFRKVQSEIIDWSADPNHEVEALPGIIAGLPDLPNIVLDGRPLFDMSGDRPKAAFADPELLEDYLLTAERIALDNRLDLMNFRAQLYDLWRQLAVQANSLLPFVNVQVNYQQLTPGAVTNPFGFNSQSNQFNVTLNAELPLIRVAERNNFRTSLINYQRARRLLMSQEDQIKYDVRQEIRNLIQFAEQYEVTKTQIVLLLRQRDQALQQLIAPPDQGGGGGFNVNLAASQATQTLNFIQSLNNILLQQNSLIQQWVSYQSLRLALYRDLGIMPFDEWEAYYELFASNPDPAAAGERPGDLPPLDRPAPPEAGRGS